MIAPNYVHLSLISVSLCTFPLLFHLPFLHSLLLAFSLCLILLLSLRLFLNHFSLPFLCFCWLSSCIVWISAFFFLFLLPACFSFISGPLRADWTWQRFLGTFKFNRKRPPVWKLHPSALSAARGGELSCLFPTVQSVAVKVATVKKDQTNKQKNLWKHLESLWKRQGKELGS